MKRVIIASAQTNRSGDAGPVRDLLGRWNLTGRFCFRDYFLASSGGFSVGERSSTIPNNRAASARICEYCRVLLGFSFAF